MRIEKRDGADERRVLTGMLVDDVVTGRVSTTWTKDGLFKSQWANLIGGWAVRYFDRYGKAPREKIQAAFESWAAGGNRDKETVQLVERFLTQLSDEYEQLSKDTNSEYVIDVAERHFNNVKLRRLRDALEGHLDASELDKAEKLIAEYGTVQMGAGRGVDVLRDHEAIREAFEDKREPLIKYPGALGPFFADAFERDAFVAFLGPEKRGKTWWLLDVAWRAMLQRRKVAFFSVGDMSQHQMMRRFQSRAARRPMKAKTVKFPKILEHEPGAPMAEVVHEEREFKKPLSWRAGVKACEKILQLVKSEETLLRLACYPNSTLSVSGLASVLKNWERGDGWTPDVIVIDYADILATPPGFAESRDAINATWKHLRRMSQEQHCLIVTATQADAASYKQADLDMSNFSEDKRKFAHVTGMVGINQTPDEYANGLQRLNWLALRESEMSINKHVHVAGCRDIANPAVRSVF